MKLNSYASKCTAFSPYSLFSTHALRILLLWPGRVNRSCRKCARFSGWGTAISEPKVFYECPINLVKNRILSFPCLVLAAKVSIKQTKRMGKFSDQVETTGIHRYHRTGKRRRTNLSWLVVVAALGFLLTGSYKYGWKVLQHILQC